MDGDLRAIDQADVYKGAMRAGVLRRRGDDVVFEYVAAYLENDTTPAVAWTLPKTEQPVVQTGGSLPPFFAGLLPEGARLQAVVAATRTSIDDHLTLLLAVGNDTIGDVRVVPRGAPLVEPRLAMRESEASIADLDEVFAQAVGTNALTFDPAALPGVQPKVSAAIWSAPLRTEAGPAILKLDGGRYPRLIDNEHFFLRVARDCGLRVPLHRLVRDAKGQAGLLVQRFDRVPTTGGVGDRAQEDACQVMGVFPAAKYRMKTEDAVEMLAQVCERSGGSARVARLELLRLIAFSYLIGNGDLHGKNISIGAVAGERWEPTPAYDLICTQPYFAWRDPMALDLYGRANRLTGRVLIEAGERWRVPARATTRMLDQLVRGVGSWIERVAEVGFESKVTSELSRMLERRRSELERR